METTTTERIDNKKKIKRAANNNKETNITNKTINKGNKTAMRIKENNNVANQCSLS